MRCSKTSWQSGFTLLEVLMSAAILAFSVGATLSYVANILDYNDEIRRKVFASWVARNAIAEIITSPRLPTAGFTSENVNMFDQLWTLRRQAKRSELDPDYWRIEIQVFFGSQQKFAETELITLIPDPLPDEEDEK